MDNRTIPVVSPYLFIPKYERYDETVYHDGSELILKWLALHPKFILTA